MPPNPHAVAGPRTKTAIQPEEERYEEAILKSRNILAPEGPRCLRAGGSRRTDDGKPKKGHTDMNDIADKGPVGVRAEKIYGLEDMVLPASYRYGAPTTDPNWKSQKTRRKNRRRLSNAPKAVKKRMGFRERRG